ncbi:hypothetical protein DFQ13_10735 [Actinokineospora spheciospongiae]|nr:hypothetical protein DFQ13_10735 [Actinokineospora spheciospongiae]
MHDGKRVSSIQSCGGCKPVQHQIEIWHDPGGRFTTCDAPVLVPFTKNVRRDLLNAPCILWPISPHGSSLSEDFVGEKAVIRKANAQLRTTVRTEVEQLIPVQLTGRDSLTVTQAIIAAGGLPAMVRAFPRVGLSSAPSHPTDDCRGSHCSAKRRCQLASRVVAGSSSRRMCSKASRTFGPGSTPNSLPSLSRSS